jgi:hypothetical protein
VPLDTRGWEVIQYEVNFQGDASWIFDADGGIATQSINADPSMLVSNINFEAAEITGRFLVQTSGDDDYIGFVFGYQDRSHYYLFDWKQGTQAHCQPTAYAGMNVKVVDSPDDPSCEELWPSESPFGPEPDAGAPTIRTLWSAADNGTPGWADNHAYDFRLVYEPGRFTIEIYEPEVEPDAGATLIAGVELEDDTYHGGRFGFYNYSQNAVRYEFFRARNLAGE